MAIFLIGKIRSLFTASGEMEDKKTCLQIPNSKEESKRTGIRSNLEGSSTEPYFRQRLQVCTLIYFWKLMLTNRNMCNIKSEICWFTLYKFLRKAGILLEALFIMPANEHDNDQCYPVGAHADPFFSVCYTFSVLPVSFPFLSLEKGKRCEPHSHQRS